MQPVRSRRTTSSSRGPCPRLRSRFAEVGLELPQQVGATFLGDANYLHELIGDTPPLDDNHPQRLRPRRHRPSLSDPGYGVDPAVTRLYQTVTDPARARQAFVTSPFIRATVAGAGHRRDAALFRTPGRLEPGDVGGRPTPAADRTAGLAADENAASTRCPCGSWAPTTSRKGWRGAETTGPALRSTCGA